MRIAIGCDHGGLDLKEAVLAAIKGQGLEAEDYGTYSRDSVDYPDFAAKVCEAIVSGKHQRGILICGTGLGMSMAANKFRGIRAACVSDVYSAKMSREHNDANVLCIGARVIGSGLANEIVNAWLTTEFGAGRHVNRVNKIIQLEERS